MAIDAVVGLSKETRDGFVYWSVGIDGPSSIHVKDLIFNYCPSDREFYWAKEDGDLMGVITLEEPPEGFPPSLWHRMEDIAREMDNANDEHFSRILVEINLQAILRDEETNYDELQKRKRTGRQQSSS